MKRFALTICLAACLMLALGAPAMAQLVDRVEVESASVGQGGNVSVGISVENAAELVNMTIPLVIREIDPGSYMTNLTMVDDPAGARIIGSLDGIHVLNTYPTQNATSCGVGFAGSGSDPLDYVSPDGILFSRQSVFPATPLAPGTDFGGTPSFRIDMTVTNTPGQFEIDTTCTDPANHLLYVLSGGGGGVGPAFTKGIITILQNQCPNASASDMSATVGSPASNQVSASDAENNPIEYFMVSGPGSVDANGLWSYTPVCADVPGFDVSIEATDKGQGGCPGSVVTFHVTVNPTALVVNCSDQSVLWGDLASQSIAASGGCPPYSYEVDAGTPVGSIDVNGEWSYQTSCQDVGTVPVQINVADDAGQVTSCTFNLTVTNTAPTCTNPADITVPNDGLEKVVVLGPPVDADGDALTYTQVSGPSWGGIVGNEWRGTRDPGDDAEYSVCFTVSDGCETSTQCCFLAQFESPFRVCIKGIVDTALSPYLDNYSTTLGGREKEVFVWVDPSTGSSKGVGGFDFLICYDNSLLSFMRAARGPDLDPTWEYFTYRTGMFGGNCGGACPDGFIRLVGVADMNNGVTPDPTAFSLGGSVVSLTFFVSSDQNATGSCPHVGFCSYDCGDNVISSKDGNTLFLPSSGATLGPDYGGCIDSTKVPAEPFIDFCPGAICIVPPPDDRGDINLNGIANEIGDAVLFSSYFINGSGVWDPVYSETQIFATDVNNDGLTLTVADLVYLIRIITGDEQPFPNDNQNPKVSPYANAVDVVSDVRGGVLTVTTNTSVDLGGALLVYRYSDVTVGEPVLVSGSGLKMKSRLANGELRVLIYPDPAVSSGKVPAGLNNLVTIPVEGDGAIELVESQFSDADGSLLAVEAAKVNLPTSYALQQNFPNPFNAGTVIPISLKEASDWTLTIYNVAGQVVRTFSGSDEAGVVNVAWDGTSSNGESVASGMYFYRATAGNFTATKKMVLLK